MTQIPMHITEDDPIKNFHLDYQMLARVIKWNCENNPKFIGTTAKDRARLCGISESTYNTILNGKNTKPRIDILYAIVASFDGYIDPLVGLAPERDLDREKQHYDGTFMESMQWQLEKAQTEISQKKEEAAALNIELAKASTECSVLRREIEEMHKALRGHRIFNAAITIFVIAAMLFVFYLIFIDFRNPNWGLLQY